MSQPLIVRRIGILANTFEKNFGGLAGGNVHFIEVAKRWKNVELRVFAPEIARATIERELPMATFVAMPSGDSSIGNAQLRNLFRTIAGLYRRRQLRECDALLASSHFLPDIAPALMSLPGRTAVNVHHILLPPKQRPGPRLQNQISAAFQSLAFVLIRTFAAAIFVYSADVASKVRVEGRKPRVFLMSNGADPPVVPVDPANKRKGAVYVGRLVPTKGIEDLLRAWASVVRSGVVAELTIAGGAEPAYREHLDRLTQNLGISDSVIFRGVVTEDEKSRILGTSRVFAFASKEEGWGIVLAEAMRHGLPCVTYDLPAVRDIFNRGRVGIPLGDVAAFSNALARLLTDDALQRSVAAEAVALAATFTWERAATLEFEALEKIADA